ncbi:MAG: hypothetical protein ACK6EB_26575 [Planctomyces sp.]|jgi:hypothetical protein
MWFSVGLSLWCVSTNLVFETQEQPPVLQVSSEVYESTDKPAKLARVRFVDKTGARLPDVRINGTTVNLAAESGDTSVELAFKGETRAICDVVVAGQLQRFVAHAGRQYVVSLIASQDEEKKAAVELSIEVLRLRLELLDVATDKWAEAKKKQAGLQEGIEKLQRGLAEQSVKHKRLVTMQERLREGTDQRKSKAEESFLKELARDVANCVDEMAEGERDLKSMRKDLEKATERSEAARKAVHDLLQGLTKLQ